MDGERARCTAFGSTRFRSTWPSRASGCKASVAGSSGPEPAFHHPARMQWKRFSRYDESRSIMNAADDAGRAQFPSDHPPIAAQFDELLGKGSR